MNIAIIDDEAPFRTSITAAIDEWVKKSKISAAVNEYSSAESFLFAYEEKCRMERSFGTFGNNSKLFFPYNLAGQENIAIGENTVILEHSRMNVWKDKDGNYPKVVIGNNCYISFREEGML